MRKIIFLLSFTFCFFTSFSQKSAKEKRQIKKQQQMNMIQKIITEKQFIFHARSLTSNTGYNKNLTSSYDLSIKKDSCFSDLPFYGESHMPIINKEGGIHFATISEKYKSVTTKKGYEISFTAEGKNDQYEVIMYISKIGYANINITSVRKSRISFYGIIEPIKFKE